MATAPSGEISGSELSLGASASAAHKQYNTLVLVVHTFDL